MRIAINAILVGEQNTGVENYIYCLLSEFDQLNIENNIDITAYFKKILSVQKDYQFQNLEIIPVNSFTRFRPVRIVWEHFVFPFISNIDFDVIHAPGYIMPIFSKIPVVATIHDLISLQYPELCSSLNSLYYRQTLPFSVIHSTRIIVPSYYVKNELFKISNVLSKKIIVIPEGVREIFKSNFNEKLKAANRLKYNLPEKYLLFVGTQEPKKNIELVLSIFEKLTEKFTDLGLVLVGKTGWKSKKVIKKMDRLKKNKNFITTGYIPTEDLAVIYNMAEIFIFPSIMEGFGVPPLEAMASGTPVISSDRGSIPEVVGSAAIKLNPNNIEEYFKAVTNVLENDDLRHELREKGLERAELFSWKKAAKKTIEVYESI